MTVPCIHGSTKKLPHKDNLSLLSTKGFTLKAMGFVKFKIKLSPAELKLTTANYRKNLVRKFAIDLDFAAECFGAKIKY